MGYPRFNDALRPGGLGRQSESLFEGTTARVFPLKANVNVLRTFCNAYLNIAPDIARFEPSFPYVLLMVLDYGRMAAETTNAGWVSQHEVAFAVPLEWYDAREDPKHPRFVDYAAVCPFIYVDDEISLAMGRRVYGWPKVKVWTQKEVNPWVDDPMSPQHLLSLSTMVYPELYAGVRQEPRVFLEIHRDVLPRYTPFPPDPSHPSNPFAVIPRALGSYVDIFTAALEIVTRAPQLGYAPDSPFEALLGLQRLAGWSLSALARNASFNNVTLKQFRDTEEPHLVCYQALVNSRMRLQRINATGILGESNQLLGDPTGGFSVRLRRYKAQPIIESLGLEVAEEVEIEGVAESVLRTAFPFWMDVDLEYGAGETIAWRTKHSGWHCGEDAPRQAKGRAYFNTTRGAAIQGVTGPFDFPKTTLRVLPLLADPATLQSLCERYLRNDFFRFEAWGRYVYLAIANYDEMSSETNNIGWWADRDLNFYVPVKVWTRGGDLVSVGVVPMYSFTNTSAAAITGVEVLGLPSVRATLRSPPDVWMEESGPSDSADQPVLSCQTQVLPALYMGQEVELGTVLEITRADALPPEDPSWSHVAEDWGWHLMEDHRRMVARAGRKKPKKKRKERQERRRRNHENAIKLSEEVLALRQPLNVVTLKQFGDAQDPSRACYQSIVRLRQIFEHVYDMREIEHRLHVRIHRQPTLPIVERLGLVTKTTDNTGAAPVDVLQPVRPFWMKVALRAELGTTLCWRSGSEKWHHGHEKDPEGPGQRPLQRRGYFEETEERRSGVLPLEAARKAVRSIEPQMVLEPLLSRREEPGSFAFRIRSDSVGPEPGTFFEGVKGRFIDDERWFTVERR